MSSRPSEWTERGSWGSPRRDEERQGKVKEKRTKRLEYFKLRRIKRQRKKNGSGRVNLSGWKKKTNPARPSGTRNAPRMTRLESSLCWGSPRKTDPRIAARDVMGGVRERGTRKLVCERQARRGQRRGCRAKFRVLSGSWESLVAPWEAWGAI